MSRDKNKHKNSSNRIRAKTKIFVNSTLEKSFNSANTRGRILCHDDLDIFRRNVKYTVADIERHASNIIKPNLKISEKSVNVINNNYRHTNDYVVGFIECLITSYNEANTSSILINLSATYKSKQHSKIMQQAKKNCEKTITAYVDKIIENMKSGQWKNATEYDIDKLMAIEPAVHFFCEYITFLSTGTIPDKISSIDYSSAFNHEPKIEKYYSYDVNEDCYTLNKNANNKINNFNQECLTFLFCKYNKLKK